jgi:hypothetical protein
MPTDRLAVILDLDGEITIQGTLTKFVVTLRPVAIQGEFLNVDNEHLSRHCCREESMGLLTLRLKKIPNQAFNNLLHENETISRLTRTDPKELFPGPEHC